MATPPTTPVDPFSLLPQGAKLLDPAPVDAATMLPPGARLIDAPKPVDNSTWQGDLEAGIAVLNTILPGLQAAKGATDLARGQTLGDMATDLNTELAAVNSQIAAVQQEALQLGGNSMTPANQAMIAGKLNPLIDRRNQLSAQGGSMGAQALPGYAAADQASGVRELGEAIPEITKQMQIASAIPMNPSAQAFGAAEGDTTGQKLASMWDALSDDPTGVLRTFALRSLPASAPTMLAGIVGSLGGPGGAAALAGLVGGKTEEGASMAQYLTEALAAQNVNVNDPAALQAWAEGHTPELLGMIADARTRALAIGAVEAVGGGLTAKIATALPAAVSTGSRVARVAGGGVVEAGLEGAGEAAAGYATTGEVDLGEVGAEIIGAGGMGAVQTGGQMIAAARNPNAPVAPPAPGSNITPEEAPAAPAPEEAAPEGVAPAQPVAPQAEPAVDPAVAALPEGAKLLPAEPETAQVEPETAQVETEQVELDPTEVAQAATPDTEVAPDTDVDTDVDTDGGMDTDGEVDSLIQSIPEPESDTTGQPATATVSAGETPRQELQPGHMTPDFVSGSLPTKSKGSERAATDGNTIVHGSWALRADLIPATVQRKLPHVDREGVDRGAPSVGAVDRILKGAPALRNEAQEISWRVGVSNGENIAAERVVGVLPDGTPIAVEGGTFGFIVNELGFTLAASGDGKMLGVYDDTGERVGAVLPVKTPEGSTYLAGLQGYDPSQRQKPGRQTPPKPRNTPDPDAPRLDRKAIEAERSKSVTKLDDATKELERRVAAGDENPVRVELETPSGRKTTFTFPATEEGVARAKDVRAKWASKPAGNLADTTGSFTTRSPKGGFTPSMKSASFTERLSDYEQAYRDAGMDPNEAKLLPPQQQINILARLMRDTFGIEFERGTGANHLKGIEAIQQLLDAYRNLKMMAFVLGLPEKALGLKGLTVTLEKWRGRYLGVYSPSERRIGMPGRSNSFAHEWGHALDHFLSLETKGIDAMLTHVGRANLLDPSESLDTAFANLINTMFYDEAELAATILDLEREAAKTVTRHGPNHGQPTQKALEAQEQLERLKNGASQKDITPSKFRENSMLYGWATGGKGGAAYYGSVHEMLARAFEAYIAFKVESEGGTNEFITKGDQSYLSDADARLANTFPKAVERVAIFNAFEAIFDHLRTDQTLATGKAAERPTDTDIRNPAEDFMAGVHADKGLVSAIVSELGAFGRAVAKLVRNPIATLKGGASSYALNLGMALKDGESVAGWAKRARQNFGDVTLAYFNSLRGMAERITKRQPKDAQLFLNHVLSKVMTNPGDGDIRLNKEVTFEEARERITTSAANRIASKIKALKLGSGLHKVALTKEQNAALRPLLTYMTPAEAKRKGVDPRLIELAGTIRDIMNETYTEATKAGIKLGYIEDTGYLPRVVVNQRVNDEPEAFRRDAEKLYGVVFDDMASQIMDDTDVRAALRLAAATAARKWPSTPVKNSPFATAVKALKKANKALAKAEKNAAANPSDQAASDAAVKAEADLEAALEALLDEVRDPFREVSAADWQTRISVGTSTTFDTLGPDASFNKPRKLPKEADEIMAKWYEEDPIHSALTYVHNLSSRAKYQQSFGTLGGAERLREVLNRQSVQDTIRSNPSKYNERTAEGRLNILRDLADPSTDNVMQMALFEAEEHGAAGADIGFFRATVENITGRGGHSGGYNFASKLSATLYVLNYVTFLPKTAMTAITEPIATMMRTGSSKTAARALFNYVREGFRGAESVQELNALAQMIGIVSSPLNDMIMMNRLSGDFGNAVGGNVIVANFFRANGLTQLTNAQRRAVLSAGMFWMRDLARTAVSSKNPAKKAIAKAELLELGITEQDFQEFAEWLAEGEGLLKLDEVDTPKGRLFANAAARLVDQTIQNPRRADKPLYASTNFGRVAYALMSFLYTFYRNIHVATVKRVGRDYNLARGAGANKALSAGIAGVGASTSFIGGFALMFVGQLAASIAREALFNREQWGDKDDEERDTWLAALAFSRTGVLGPGDILFNMLTGLRYERDLANGVIGSYPAMALSNIQNMVKGLPKTELWEGGPGVGLRNSPGTDTAERTAAKSFYRLVVAPAAATAISAIPAGGPISWATRYGALVTSTSNSASGGFADAVGFPADD